jgi:hypothetical protein
MIVVAVAEHSSGHFGSLRYLILLENPGIPLPFRIQTASLKVLDLKFKVLDEIN